MSPPHVLRDEDGSLIWHSRWVTTTGIIECREALAFPADPDTAVILRRIVAVDGEAAVHVLLDAQADFGQRPVAAGLLGLGAGATLAKAGWRRRQR